ncbi:IS3 family transposase [Flavobacterium sp. WC2430]|uniref:IS3 family transposase n=1 Tax=Flavobacterium sp. WC2430 TaxID=3234137 RepID=UPI003467E63D
MGKVYANDFKIMIVELLKSGKSLKEISEEYGLNDSMLRRWRREFDSKSGDFSKKIELSAVEVELKKLKKELQDVKLERDIPKKGGEHLFQERQIRYKFISENKNQYPVEKMCYCMKVSKNAYYHWLKSSLLDYKKSDTLVLMEKIEQVFYENKEIYGSYRIQKKLEQSHLYYSRSYIAFLMKKLGLRSVLKRKFIITTDSNHTYPIAKNILNRDFTSNQLGQKWVSDITYVRVNDQWNYLTTIMDLADRKIIGWTLSEDMTVENTIYKAWLLAKNTRKTTPDHIFHSDRGVQYASKKMNQILDKNTKTTQSMSRKGNCWDNAVAESFFKTIKYECLYRYKFNTYQQLYDCTSDYIQWYNTQRLHSSLGYKTPLQKEIELRDLFKIAA